MVPPVENPPAVSVPDTRPEAALSEPAVEKLAATAAPVLDSAPELVTDPASITPLNVPEAATTEEPVSEPAADRAPAIRVRPPTDRSSAVVKLPTLAAFVTDSTPAVRPPAVLRLPATSEEVMTAVLALNAPAVAILAPCTTDVADSVVAVMGPAELMDCAVSAPCTTAAVAAVIVPVELKSPLTRTPLMRPLPAVNAPETTSLPELVIDVAENAVPVIPPVADRPAD